MPDSGREFHRIWSAQCQAARNIQRRFGAGNALNYLIGEKLLAFAEIANRNPDFARELPRFLAEVRRVFAAAEIGAFTERLELTRPLTPLQRNALRTIASGSSFSQ